MSFHIEEHNRLPFDKRTSGGDQQPAYDLVCIGFGTTALPVAASLADETATARVLFLEKEARFTWNPESLFPDKAVGTSFLRDLATTQNPRSAYTFMNYLHATGQIIDYANNSRLAPSRRLMGNYFRWAANSIQQLGWIRYGQEAIRIEPVRVARRVVHWSIQTRDCKSGTVSAIQAHRVIIATGATPRIPVALAVPELKSLVVHASTSASVLAKVTDSKMNIAVIGADQDAAEVFEDLNKRRGQHTATMFLADSALRPEATALEKAEFQPGTLPPEIRQRLQSGDLTSPKVSLATLESLYLARYTQQIAEQDASKWRFQMKTLSEVVGLKKEGEKARLVIKNPRTGDVTISDQTFDVVIAATGYDFAVNGHLIAAIASILDGESLAVDRDYRVNFRRETLARNCGIWMLGSLTDVKQRGDDFTFMAERSRRVAQSVLKDIASHSKFEQQREQAVL